MKKKLTPTLLILIVVFIISSGYFSLLYYNEKNKLGELILSHDADVISYADLKTSFDKLKTNYDNLSAQNGDTGEQLNRAKMYSDNQDVQVKLLESCGIKECFGKSEALGNSYAYADIEGYYKQAFRLEPTAQGLNGIEHSSCDTFVITNSTKKAKDYFLAEANNSGLEMFYKIDSAGQPVINIDLSKLSAADKEKIIASNKNKTIKLSVSENWPLGATGLEETPACSSFTNILKVE